MLAALRFPVAFPALNITQIALIACCANGFLDRMIADLRGSSPTLLLGLSPFELLIVFVAARAIRDTPDNTAPRWRHYMLGLALLFPSGSLAWLALALFAGYEAWRARGEERFGPLLFAGLAIGQLWLSVGFKLFTDALLWLDAISAALALQAFGFETSVTGNLIDVPAGNTIIVLVTCSTFERMPLAIVSAIALAGPARALVLLEIALITFVGCALMNLARLVGMGWSPEAYEIIHNGWGASVYDAAQTILVFLAALRVRP